VVVVVSSISEVVAAEPMTVEVGLAAPAEGVEAAAGTDPAALAAEGSRSRRHRSLGIERRDGW
jgi:hypothetical protein